MKPEEQETKVSFDPKTGIFSARNVYKENSGWQWSTFDTLFDVDFSKDEILSFYLHGKISVDVVYVVVTTKGKFHIPYDLSNRDEIYQQLKSTGKETKQNALIQYFLPFGLTLGGLAAIYFIIKWLILKGLFDWLAI